MAAQEHIDIPWKITMAVPRAWDRAKCIKIAEDMLMVQQFEEAGTLMVRARELGGDLTVTEWIIFYEAVISLFEAMASRVSTMREVEAERDSRNDAVGKAIAEWVKRRSIDDGCELAEAIEKYLSDALKDTNDESLKLFYNMFCAEINVCKTVYLQDGRVRNVDRAMSDALVKRHIREAQQSASQVLPGTLISLLFNHRYSIYLAEYKIDKPGAWIYLRDINLGSVVDMPSGKEKEIMEKMISNRDAWLPPKQSRKRRT